MRSRARRWPLLVSTVSAAVFFFLIFSPIQGAADTRLHSVSGRDDSEIISDEGPGPEGDMLDGIFSGLTRGLSAGAGGVDFSVSAVHVTFYPDGWIYRRVPEGGLEGWDREASVSAVPDLWGTYRPLGPDSWEIRWNYTDRPAVVVREGEGLRYEDSMVFPVASLEGQRLHAIYAHPGFANEQDPYYIAFNDEGLFLDYYLIGAIAYIDLNSYDSRTIVGGAGHYRIGRNTLYLEYENGQRVAVEIHAQVADAEASPVSPIFINGTDLVAVSDGQ